MMSRLQLNMVSLLGLLSAVAQGSDLIVRLNRGMPQRRRRRLPSLEQGRIEYAEKYKKSQPYVLEYAKEALKQRNERDNHILTKQQIEYSHQFIEVMREHFDIGDVFAETKNSSEAEWLKDPLETYTRTRKNKIRVQLVLKENVDESEKVRLGSFIFGFVNNDESGFSLYVYQNFNIEKKFRENSIVQRILAIMVMVAGMNEVPLKSIVYVAEQFKRTNKPVLLYYVQELGFRVDKNGKEGISKFLGYFDGSKPLARDIAKVLTRWIGEGMNTANKPRVVLTDRQWFELSKRAETYYENELYGWGKAKEIWHMDSLKLELDISGSTLPRWLTDMTDEMINYKQLRNKFRIVSK